MKILVIDGQGGGIGKALVTKLVKALPDLPIVALGTNALATASMLKAGAAHGATGEHAIIWQSRDAGIILGVTGLLVTGAMMGEISPAISSAIGQSTAAKILIPSERCGLKIVGGRQASLDEALNECVDEVRKLVKK